MSSSTATISLAESQHHCARVAQEQARNFYYGMKLVPEPRRSAMFALYAWMREADDLADEPGELELKTRTLNQFRDQTHAIVRGDRDNNAEHAMWPAVREMIQRYEIPMEYLDEMIAGQLLDQEKTRYQTFEELYDYCYKVASVVGLCCIHIWGYDGGEETRQLAEWRGIAFQLTNILRDVKEDANRDRVYLPAEEFDVFEINPPMFLLSNPDDLRPHLKNIADRALGYYEQSAALDTRIHNEGRACLWAMTSIYRGILNRILGNPTIVLEQRVSLGKWHKSWIALRATLKGKGRSR